MTMTSLPRQQQLRELAYQRLKEGIVSLELAPGTPLREVTLASALGVSKTPVREALVRLANEGLVTIEPYRGAIVSTPTATERREIYELRALLEGDCARRAAEAMPDESRRALAAIAAMGPVALAAGDVKALVVQFEQFDALLRGYSGSARVRTLLDNLSDHIRRIGNLTVGIPGRLETSVAQHAHIEAAIRAGDGELAERLVRAHVHSVLADFGPDGTPVDGTAPVVDGGIAGGGIAGGGIAGGGIAGGGNARVGAPRGAGPAAVSVVRP